MSETDKALGSYLTGMLLACCVGSFTDEQLGVVFALWTRTCLSSRAESEEDTLAWCHSTMARVFDQMAKSDPTPEMARLLERLQNLDI
jgi:hypothetical protein